MQSARATHAFVFAIAVGACGDGTVAGETMPGAETGTSGSPTTAATSAGSGDDDTGTTAGPTDPPPSWDPEVEPPPCGYDPAADLLLAALGQAGLTPETFAFTDADFAHSAQHNAGVLGGDATFSWLWEVRADPGRAACFEDRTAGVLDGYLASPHPVAGMIRHAAGLVDRPVDEATPYGVGDGFDAAVARLCATVSAGCDPASGSLPPELAETLAPVVWAIEEGVQARLAMDASPGGNPAFWRDNGGNALIGQNGLVASPSDADARAYMLGAGVRERLYRAAAQIAFAIENADWEPWTGRTGIEYELETAAGWIVVKDAADHVYPADEREILLLLDLGGADEHLDEVASNRSGGNPVSIAIDLGGADVYHYDEVPSPADVEGLLPSDADGRATPSFGNGEHSLSNRFRQGAARNGIAMLFDLGDSDDRYQSLRGSQGYAHLGVGVLFDAGGRDSYLAEANAQGSAQFGIGLLVDAGVQPDRYRAFTFAQGFGFVASAGVLVDGGGDDHYDCDHGDPAAGGLALYYSPQRPGTGNSSMCQGAAFGNRSDLSTVSSLAGGIGILRDVAGDDAYDASVFAQGTGFWEGTGVLSDGGGSDRYDAYWYVQGGAAHYAVGMLVDEGDGDDVFNRTRPSQLVNLGAGHDYSLGVLLNEAGDDRYFVTGLAAGASNCNGIGLFVDGAGDDTYDGVSDLSSGVGNVSDECLGARPDATSIGLMIDAGGVDAYAYPSGGHPDFVAPSDGGVWGYARFGLPSEHGGGVDGLGPSGLGP